MGISAVQVDYKTLLLSISGQYWRFLSTGKTDRDEEINSSTKHGSRELDPVLQLFRIWANNTEQEHSVVEKTKEKKPTRKHHVPTEEEGKI